MKPPPMHNIDIKKVCTSKGMRDFIHVTYEIYRDCPQYVPDLESDVRGLFDVRTNPGLAFCSVQPFVAYRDGKAVGRVVGIVNRRANERWQQSNVRFSMIEFVDDVEVSRALLEAVEQWGREQGMQRMQGPLGVTDFDKEGMLISDFDLLGSMNTIYNHDYYPRHMEALGLQKEVDWVQVHIDVPREIPARYARVAAYCREQMQLRVVKVTNADITRGGYGQKIFELLNAAYEPLFAALSPDQADNFIRKYLRLIDKQLIPVVLNAQDEVVGVGITMGSLSHAMQKAKGRLLPTGWLHLLKALRWKREDNAEMLLIAVRPDYQGKGVNALFFNDLIPIYNRYGFRWAETGPQLEDNIRELTQWKPLNPRYVKRRRCYYKDIN